MPQASPSSHSTSTISSPSTPSTSRSRRSNAPPPSEISSTEYLTLAEWARSRRMAKLQSAQKPTRIYSEDGHAECPYGTDEERDEEWEESDIDMCSDAGEDENGGSNREHEWRDGDIHGTQFWEGGESSGSDLEKEEKDANDPDSEMDEDEEVSSFSDWGDSSSADGYDGDSEASKAQCEIVFARVDYSDENSNKNTKEEDEIESVSPRDVSWPGVVFDHDEDEEERDDDEDEDDGGHDCENGRYRWKKTMKGRLSAWGRTKVRMGMYR